VLHHHGSITELPYPPYSSDLAPADYYRFLSFIYIKLEGHHYASDSASQGTIHQWLQRVENNFYQAGIYSLIQGWKKTLGKCGVYIAK